MDREKRILQTQRVISNFITRYDLGHSIVENDAAEKITWVYDGLLTGNVKPYLEDKTRCFKMASAYEQAILLVEPLYFEKEQERKQINARFAFFTASNLVYDFYAAEKIKLERLKGSELSKDYHKRKDDHMKWLEGVDPKVFPILSNSFFLNLFFESYFKKTPLT